VKNIVKAFAVVSLLLIAAAAPGNAVSAQTIDANGVPLYGAWQPGWDTNVFDRRHVILGVVRRFQPYRLWVRRLNGHVQKIDLKNGTVILPTGATPTRGERIAIIGYYSGGTFIANRLVLH